MVNDTVYAEARKRVGQPRDDDGKFLSTKLYVKPTAKVLFRWANKWVEAWERNYNRFNYFSESVIDLNKLRKLDSILKYRRKLLTNNAGIAKWLQFETWSRSYLNGGYELVKNLTNEATSIRDRRTPAFIPKVKDVYNELVTLVNAVPCLYDRLKKSLFLPTERVILSPSSESDRRYDFGSFRVYLSPDVVNIESLLIIANSPRHPLVRGSIRSEISHPHVKNDHLCFGAGKLAAISALHAGRIFDLTQIIFSVLQTYGGTYGYNPYATITSWDGICDYRVDPKTGEPIPIDHVELSTTTRIVECQGCRAVTTQLYSCSVDGCRHTNLCIGCLPRCESQGCMQSVCRDHLCSCGVCGCYLCAEHPSGLCAECEAQTESEEEPEEDDEEDDELDSES